MNKPLFSVVVPAYNRGYCIERTLDSVWEQDYRPIEVIVIDDGSTDDTAAVVQQWAAKHSDADDFVLHYHWQENARVSAARNNGQSRVTGKYVQFLDSDDLLAPTRFSKAAEHMEAEEAELFVSAFDIVTDELDRIKTVNDLAPDEDLLEQVIRKSLYVIPLRFVLKKTLLDRVGLWDATFTQGEDTEFLQRAVLESKQSIIVTQILGFLTRGRDDHLSTEERPEVRLQLRNQLYKQMQEKGGLDPKLFRWMNDSIAYRAGIYARRGQVDIFRECRRQLWRNRRYMTLNVALRLILLSLPTQFYWFAHSWKKKLLKRG